MPTNTNEDTMTKDEQIAHLKDEINKLAEVLIWEFGGPDRDESACEMAVRLLREYKASEDQS